MASYRAVPHWLRNAGRTICRSRRPTSCAMSPGDTMLVDWEGKAGAGWGRLFPDEQVPVQRRREG
jgi:hypothetical protein